MSKIHSIHINNFKFFGESKPIVLGAKNLLLYGENGSGKSSIYNSLYTLLEAASKTPEEVRKYFLPLDKHSQSLVNIFAPIDEHGLTDSYIEVTDDNGKIIRLAYDDTTICGINECKESQRASDFINYKSLFRFQLFRNSEYSDLHEVFDYSIIPYLKCPEFDFLGRDISSLLELFRLYKDVDVYKDANKSGKKVIYKRGKKYTCFKNLEEAINDYMFKLVDGINIQLNGVKGNTEEKGILEQLGYTFKAKLEYKPLTHRKTYTNIYSTEYKVLLSISVKRDGKEVVIEHPNVFLNEAKISALAFGIRWAILSRRPGVSAAPNALRVLVLDDIMISLDMCNRENLIKLLLGPDANNFQLLFMTHDRNLYNFVKEKIDPNLWITKEMYVGEEDETNKEYPIIIDGEEEPIEKAKKYYVLKDYVTSGLYIRKALEKLFVIYCPKNCILNQKEVLSRYRRYGRNFRIFILITIRL